MAFCKYCEKVVDIYKKRLSEEQQTVTENILGIN